MAKGKCHMFKLCTVPYNANWPIYNSIVPFYDTGSVEEWLKFGQNLQDIITGQNNTNAQEGVNKSQSKPSYKKMMQDVHMYFQTFLARVDETKDQLEEFPHRDDGNP
eukprot:13511616-Ditylum_brightwellii.AAC.1